MKLLLRPFPEIAIKSKPVRRQQTRQLAQNVRKLLSRHDDRFEVLRDWDKIEITGPEELLASAAVMDILTRIPGIERIVVVREFPFIDFDDILQRLVASIGESLTGKTFVVRVKRQGEHEFTSMQLEKYLGGGLLQGTQAKGVDLKQPDVLVKVDVRFDQYQVVSEQVPGLGGFPLGSQEPVLSLLSGGYDSSVASYLSMRRGMMTHFCFFNLGGDAHEEGVRRIASHLWERYGSTQRVLFISVPFRPVVEELERVIEGGYRGVILKRQMLRVADRIAEDLEINALVTGEAVAQVSSQTVANLNVIDRAVARVVFRPLITTDKPDIIRMAEKIGCAALAAGVPEYCGEVSEKPTTKATLPRCEHYESALDPAVLEAAFAGRSVISVDRLKERTAEPGGVVATVDAVAEGDVLIDIRHPGERRLTLPSCAQHLDIPYFQLQAAFAALDPKARYILWCERGSMSRLHAADLLARGFSNVAVLATDA